MRKKVRKKIPLLAIQEEGLLTPLCREQSIYVQLSSMEIRKFTYLEYGLQGESFLTSHVEMVGALVEQIIYHSFYSIFSYLMFIALVLMCYLSQLIPMSITS